MYYTAKVQDTDIGHKVKLSVNTSQNMWPARPMEQPGSTKAVNDDGRNRWETA